jgi:hypothetical protein
MYRWPMPDVRLKDVDDFFEKALIPLRHGGSDSRRLGLKPRDP